jgi:DNA-nicking Smr family endonuclease
VSWLRRLLTAAFPGAAPELDLHGMRVPEALDAVEAALAEVTSGGGKGLRIVCGKGKGSPGGVGVLRSAVAGWLDAHGYEGRYRREVDSDGRDGVLWVELRAPCGEVRF